MQRFRQGHKQGRRKQWRGTQIYLNEHLNNPHWWLLAFCVGIITHRFFAQLPPLLPSIAGLLILIVAAIRWKWTRPLAALALGICWANVVATSVLNRTIPLELEKQDVTITGHVIGTPQVRGAYQRFDFNVATLAWQGNDYPSPGVIRLKLYRDQPQLHNGQKWQFTARLKQARGYQNPGASFHYETYLFQHRLRASGYVRAQPPAMLLQPQNVYSLAAFRERVATFIRDSFPSSERAGLITALVVGIRNDMNADDWEVLTRTGTIHLVAISGLHIGLVSWLVLLLSARAWRWAGRLPLVAPAPKVGVVAGLLAGIVYALLAGMTIPTQRAVCMLAVVTLAMFFKRKAFSRETLLMALTAVLAIDPLAPLASGLWLSFGAVMIISMSIARTRSPDSSRLHSSRPHSSRINSSRDDLSWANSHRRKPTPSMIKGWQLAYKAQKWSAIQLALFVAMAPLLLVLFQRVSLIAPLANLIAIPIIGLFAVPIALLGLLLYSIGLEQGAVFAFSGALWIIEQLWVMLESFSNMAWSVWQQASPPTWSLPFAVIGVLLLLSPKVFPARWSGLLWLLPLFSPTVNTLDAGEFRYSMLEVGNGLASVVQTQNFVLVYDAGPSFASGFDAGDSIVIPFLQQQGADKVDTMVISHGDNDHIGGQRAVSARFDTARILTSVPEKIPTSQACEAGQSWTWDEVKFEMLSPQPAHAESGNDASCVLKISSEFGSLLLTGDIGKPTEITLANSGRDLAVDILQVPHHGSKTSSTETFLNQVQPTIALTSAGYLNRHNHPHKIVSERYARRQIPNYNTAYEGAITTNFSANGIFIKSHRQANRKYWTHPAKDLNTTIRVVPR